MNVEHGGGCNTKGMMEDGQYDVPAIEDNKSPLTGSNYINEDGNRFFTCKQLEVFALE